MGDSFHVKMNPKIHQAVNGLVTVRHLFLPFRPPR